MNPSNQDKRRVFRDANEIAYTGQMRWTLLVPGALVPEALAAELARAAPTPRLSHLLAQAQLAAQHHAAEADIGAAHWSWLGRTFGLDSDPPVSAPYAWQALGGIQSDVQHCWIAFCDPVHMEVGRDSVVVTDLEDAPLRAEETEELLSLAHDALREATSVPRSKAGTGNLPGAQLRLEVCNGQWFLLANTCIDLQAAPLDAVLGKPAHERMPKGADARSWRHLTNQIQMLWHASAANVGREQRGASIVNALWVHGAGQWKPLRSNSIAQVHTQDHCIDGSVLRGWLHAGEGRLAYNDSHRPENPQGDTLSVCRILFRPFAFQDWDLWLQRLILLEEHLGRELAAARARGASLFELVVCGLREARTLSIALQAPWWRRIRVTRRSSAPVLQRWFAEPDALSSQVLRR